MRGFEAAQLEFDGHQAAQAAVVEEQVQIKVVAVNDHALLALYKRKAPAQFQDEGFQLAQDGGFQIGLVVALAQAQEVEEVRVFEDLGGGERLRRARYLQGGKFGSFEGLAFDLVCQLAYAPAVLRGLVGVKLAGLRGFQRHDGDHVAPAQLCRQC